MSRAASRILTALLLGFATGVAAAQEARPEVPKNDGWVTDLAGLLDPAQERELESLMESYRRGTTHEIAVLTVPSLRGEPIERFALEVARSWGLGTKEKNNGALLVVAKEDREVRIEVGRGLEGNLTDSISGRIIRDVIVPEFRRGRFAQGIKAGVVAMHQAIGGEYEAIRRSSRSHQSDSGLVGFVPALFFLLVLFLVLSRMRRWGGRGGRVRRRVFPSWPWYMGSGGSDHGGSFGGGFGGGGFGGFGGGGGFSGGGASGRW